jgi:hypothetical protein
MSLVIGVVIERFGNAVHAVFEHALAGKKQGGQGKASFMIFTGLQFVNTFFSEKFRPQIPMATVHGTGVIGMELLH